MPHLDAKALTDPESGLEFLRSVLDVPADHPIPVGAFDPARRCAAPSTGAVEEDGVRSRPSMRACEPA